MRVAEKLRFLDERTKDEKQFSIGSEGAIYRFINSKLMYVGYVGYNGIEIHELSTSPLSLNYLLSAPLKLQPQWEFTEDEKVILRNLPDNYQWIARDKSNLLCGYGFKPAKRYKDWTSGTGDIVNLRAFNHLFQSIQWSDKEPCEFRKYL